jgi:hypothetical protein
MLPAVSCNSNVETSGEHHQQQAKFAVAAKMKHVLIVAGSCSQEACNHLLGLLLLHAVS